MTLLMRDQENLEKGMEKGMEKGLKKGMKKGKIYGAISAYRDLGLTEDVIMMKLTEKFHLSEKEIKEYIESAE